MTPDVQIGRIDAKHQTLEPVRHGYHIIHPLDPNALDDFRVPANPGKSKVYQSFASCVTITRTTMAKVLLN